MNPPAERKAYRLFCVDIDGTLTIPGTSTIPDRVAADLARCAEEGLAVVLATGKTYSSAREVCRGLSLEGLMITCNGALIVEADSGRPRRSTFIPDDLFLELIRDLQAHGWGSIAVCTDEEILCTGRHYASTSLDEIGEPTNRFVESLLELSGLPIAKVLVAHEEAEVVCRIRDDYAGRFGSRLTVARTCERYVEFMARGVSKGEAIRQVAGEYGVPLEQTACIGDSDNDLSMFEVAGLSIAVANATRAVLDAADLVVPSAEQGGIAEAVECILNNVL